MRTSASTTSKEQRRPASGPSIFVFWVAVLGGVGLVHHHFVGARNAIAADTIAPDLDAVPRHLGPWEGVDVPMDAAVLAAARTDAHLNRRYVHRESRETLDLYVAFTNSPVNMLGHRPDVCYPASGWVAESVDETAIGSIGGRHFECLLHKFSRGDTDGERLIVANYYVLPQGTTTDWSAFSGLQWRSRSASADSVVFVAQVQVVGAALFSSRVPATVDVIREFTARAAPPIAEILSQAIARRGDLTTGVSPE